MANELKLTRNQLASFLKDDEQIKQFEKLFNTVNVIAPIVEAGGFSDISGTDAKTSALMGEIEGMRRVFQIELAALNAKAQAANDEAERLKEIVARLEYAPRFVFPNQFEIDYIDFDRTPAYVGKTRRVAWSSADDTLNIHHSNGVTQQVGLEAYTRFTNNTGATIPNGTAVGLEYTGGVTLANVVPYLADGATPQLNILGITTEDVANGAQGRITVRGQIHDLDTSGFAVGDILYPSPTVAGDLTNVKPTAPQTCIPFAIVLFSHATAGIIAVRVTVEQQEWYGSFSDSTDQTLAAIYTPAAITFNTTDFSQGVSIVSSSQITVANSGLYDFQIILQLTNVSAAQKKVFVWLRHNGTDVANTVVEQTIQGNNATAVPAWNYFHSLDAGDYVELIWATDDINLFLDATAAQVGANGTAAFARPATPSAIVTVSLVAQ